MNEEVEKIIDEGNLDNHVKIIWYIFFLDAFITILLGIKYDVLFIMELILPIICLGVIIYGIIKLFKVKIIIYSLEIGLFIVFLIIIFFNIPIEFSVFQ